MQFVVVGIGKLGVIIDQWLAHEMHGIVVDSRSSENSDS